MISPSVRRSHRGPALRRVLWLVGAAAFIAIIAVLWPNLRRGERAAGGTELGRLFAGVSRDQLNLLVVTLDTTRADRFGAYGAAQIRTPVFDRLAARACCSSRPMSVAPLTLPAHVSIFTGRFPPEHGVRDNGGFLSRPRTADAGRGAQAARASGPGGFVAAYVLDAQVGHRTRGSTPISTTST